MDKKEVNMKIILLSGASNSGKTTALKALFSQLTDGGKKNVLYIRDKDDYGDNEYVIQHNQKKVAIVTDGDILWHCIEKMIKYANLDVLVMAYNTKFAFGLDVITEEYKHHR
jgi:uridine kinase